jgi:hypothetical protein
MMKAFLAFAAGLMLLVATNIDIAPVATRSSERPTVNVPSALRQSNWLDSRRHGSCALASLCTACNWEGREDISQTIRSHCGGGQSPQSLANLMVRNDIRFAWTIGDDDLEFLETALDGRRAVMVAIDLDPDTGECHMVDLVHYRRNEAWACLIDNNHPTENRWVKREVFEKDWMRTGSWAVVPLYTPAPPLAN